MSSDLDLKFVPPKTFLRSFCPVGEDTPPEIRDADFSDVPFGRNISEKDMYHPLVTELNKFSSPCRFYISPIEPPSIVVNDDDDDDEYSDKKPDKKPDARPEVWMTDHTRLHSSRRAARKSTIAQRIDTTHWSPCLTTAFDWGRCELTCEVRPSGWQDPFDCDASEDYDDSDDEDIADDTGEPSNLQQVIAYFKEQLARQHRTFVFQLFIFGAHARFVRWDRAGAIVSNRFNYRTRPHYLAGFVWRYARLERSKGRGWDSSVALAEPADAALFKDEIMKVLRDDEGASSGAAKTTAKALRTTLMAKTTLEGDYPTYTVRISSPEKWQFETTLIIRRPVHEPISPFYRATRGYLAYDKDHAEFCFFKDIWRYERRSLDPDALETDEEGATEHTNGVYISEERFYTLVRGVDDPEMMLPRVFYAGDVRDADSGAVHRVVTPGTLLAVMNGSGHGLEQTNVHHRVIQELLCPLKSSSSSRELVGITRDVLKTIKAVRKLGIIHRDLSVGNVMFRVNDAGQIEGILNDWDHCGPASLRPDDPQINVGTTAFMAIDLLCSQDASNAHHHDLESAALWVPLYFAYTHLTYTPKTRWDLDMFGGSSDWSMAMSKMCFLKPTSTHPTFPVAPPLTDLIDALCAVLDEGQRAKTVGGYPASLAPETHAWIKECRTRVESADTFIEIYEEALKKDGWPEHDQVEYDLATGLGAAETALRADYVLGLSTLTVLPSQEDHGPAQRKTAAKRKRGKKRRTQLGDTDNKNEHKRPRKKRRN